MVSFFKEVKTLPFQAIIRLNGGESGGGNMTLVVFFEMGVRNIKTLVESFDQEGKLMV